MTIPVIHWAAEGPEEGIRKWLGRVVVTVKGRGWGGKKRRACGWEEGTGQACKETQVLVRLWKMELKEEGRMLCCLFPAAFG